MNQRKETIRKAIPSTQENKNTKGFVPCRLLSNLNISTYFESDLNPFLN